MSDELPLNLLMALEQLPDINARETLIRSYSQLADHDWDEPYTFSIFQARDEKLVGKPISIYAMISSIRNPYPIDLKIGKNMKRYSAFSITLQDINGFELPCIQMLTDQHRMRLERYFRHRCFYVFQGMILSVIKKISGGSIPYYIFFLYDIKENITAQDLINLKPDPSNRIANIFIEHTSKGGILSYIKQTLINKLGIQGLENSPHLNKCVDFMIYQSFSHGMDKYNPMKLHSLIIGGPGEGKKLLSLIAKTLNPVYEEATPAKTTVAGLVGASKSDGNGWVSTPGLIPQASGGVLSIQDYHEVKKDRQRINETFAGVMADGIALDSTAAKTKHEAVTSIHLDINRQSQINTSKTFDNYSDINLPLNLISRFDFIMDIPMDLGRQISVAQDMLGGSRLIVVNRPIQDIPQWQRDLLVIIAYIRTYFHVTEIPEEVALYSQQKLNNLVQEYAFLTNERLYSGMMTRLAVSITKYALAISSANLRIKVNTDDIDKAFDFISEKIQFLSTLAQDENQTDPDIGIVQKEKRQKLITGQFSGKIVSIKEIIEYLVNQGEKPVVNKTIRRDLNDLGAENTQHGKWKIP